MPCSPLSPTTVVVRASGILDADVDQDVVALNIEKGVCCGLNSVGSRIWRLVTNPIRVADLCETLMAEYEVDYETCERDVLNILKQLRTEEMIQVSENQDSDRGVSPT